MTVLKRLQLGLRNQTPTFVIVTSVLVIHVIVALSGSWWAPYDPFIMLAGKPFDPPSWGHWFGTDNLGRDVFSRVVYGERFVLFPALMASGLAAVVGSAIGIILAYKRAWTELIGMRVVDLILCLPNLVVILIVLSALGSSTIVMILTIAFFFTWIVVQTVRSAALAIVTEDFVTKATLRGESAWSVAVREILPNVTSTVFVEFSLRTGYAVFFMGALSFLGYAAKPPTPEWGLMINEGRAVISAAPWMVLGPALALASLVVALGLFTEGVSEILGLTSRRQSAK